MNKNLSKDLGKGIVLQTLKLKKWRSTGLFLNRLWLNQPWLCFTSTVSALFDDLEGFYSSKEDILSIPQLLDALNYAIGLEQFPEDDYGEEHETLWDSTKDQAINANFN